jgi:hypothetical protein
MTKQEAGKAVKAFDEALAKNGAKTLGDILREKMEAPEFKEVIEGLKEYGFTLSYSGGDNGIYIHSERDGLDSCDLCEASIEEAKAFLAGARAYFWVRQHDTRFYV